MRVAESGSRTPSQAESHPKEAHLGLPLADALERKVPAVGSSVTNHASALSFFFSESEATGRSRVLKNERIVSCARGWGFSQSLQHAIPLSFENEEVDGFPSGILENEAIEALLWLLSGGGGQWVCVTSGL